MPDTRSLKETIWHVIFESDTPAAKAFDLVLIVAILASVAVVVLSTLPHADAAPYQGVYFGLEWVFTILFTVEYITRLAVARRPLRYALSFFGIVDLLSILPAFIGLLLPGTERLLIVRTLRVLRIFRILKLTRYLQEAQALRTALWQSRHKIAVFLTSVVIIVLIASSLMYLIEGSINPETGLPTNDKFSSIPSAMYWTIITMTTVGYGDVIPTTVGGKILTTILVLVGYSLIIVPTGILSAEITTKRQPPAHEAVIGRACPGCGRSISDPDANFCQACGENLNPD